MDGVRFDDLSRKLAAGMSRRQALKGFAAGLLGALGLRGAADAQVSQVYCGNQFCNGNPGVCKPGCVCCIYTNPITGKVINSRCQPPNLCTGQAICGPGKVLHPVQGCIPPCTGAGSCPQPPPGSCQVATCPTGGLCGFATAPNDTPAVRARPAAAAHARPLEHSATVRPAAMPVPRTRFAVAGRASARTMPAMGRAARRGRSASAAPARRGAA